MYPKTFYPGNMIKLEKYLDSTYLKTPQQAGISPEETTERVRQLVEDCIRYGFALAMIRPEYVSMAKQMIREAGSDVLTGTVIGFHEGTAPLSKKMEEARKAISDGADELDFVCNYPAYIRGETGYFKEEIREGTRYVLDRGKKIKWIIEVAALTPEQIAGITRLIRQTVIEEVQPANPRDVFVKSSTGFYPVTEGKPAGATFESMGIILEHARPLSVKAAGGVRTKNDALKMIEMGVDRIGTSSAVAIVTE